MEDEAIKFKLDQIIERLERIEQRQIKTTAMVEEVEKKEQSQTMGSFASSDLGASER
jgi:uncharacterized protein (UPF0335 family)